MASLWVGQHNYKRCRNSSAQEWLWHSRQSRNDLAVYNCIPVPSSGKLKGALVNAKLLLNQVFQTSCYLIIFEALLNLKWAFLITYQLKFTTNKRSNVHFWDSNSRPLGLDSTLIISRPGLPPLIWQKLSNLSLKTQPAL